MTESVIERLEPLFIEKNIIESRIHNYISWGKTLYFIRQKLLQKKFDTQLVEECISQSKEILSDPETYRTIIEARCKKAKDRGLSRRKIFYELQGHYPDARILIEEALGGYDDTSILQNKVLPRLLGSHSKEKIIQKCLQAGFSFRDIQTALVNDQDD